MGPSGCQLDNLQRVAHLPVLLLALLLARNWRLRRACTASTSAHSRELLLLSNVRLLLEHLEMWIGSLTHHRNARHAAHPLWETGYTWNTRHTAGHTRYTSRECGCGGGHLWMRVLRRHSVVWV